MPIWCCFAKFQDGYEGAVKELVAAKIKNMPIPTQPRPQMGIYEGPS